MSTSTALEKPAEAPIAQEIVIEGGKTELHYWRDLWRYRELFYFLAWRDILVRYKQTAIGIAWAVLQPLITTFICVFIFHFFAKLSSGERRALRDHGAGGAIAMAVFLPRAFRGEQQSHQQHQSHLENLFPAPDHSRRRVITALVDFVISAVLLAVIWCVTGITITSRTGASSPLPLFLLLAIGRRGGRRSLVCRIECLLS